MNMSKVACIQKTKYQLYHGPSLTFYFSISCSSARGDTNAEQKTMIYLFTLLSSHCLMKPLQLQFNVT